MYLSNILVNALRFRTPLVRIYSHMGYPILPNANVIYEWPPRSDLIQNVFHHISLPTYL